MCNFIFPRSSFRSRARGQSVDEFLKGCQLLLVYKFKFLDKVHKVLKGGV